MKGKQRTKYRTAIYEELVQYRNEFTVTLFALNQKTSDKLMECDELYQKLTKKEYDEFSDNINLLRLQQQIRFVFIQIYKLILRQVKAVRKLMAKAKRCRGLFCSAQ